METSSCWTLLLLLLMLIFFKTNDPATVNNWIRYLEITTLIVIFMTFLRSTPQAQSGSKLKSRKSVATLDMLLNVASVNTLFTFSTRLDFPIFT